MISNFPFYSDFLLNTLCCSVRVDIYFYSVILFSLHTLGAEHVPFLECQAILLQKVSARQFVMLNAKTLSGTILFYFRW